MVKESSKRLGLAGCCLIACFGCSLETDGTFSVSDSVESDAVTPKTESGAVNLLAGEQVGATDAGAAPWVADELSEESEQSQPKVELRERTTANRLGTVFSEPSLRWKLAPEFTEIELPELTNPYAIWGATGRDDSGNLYLGVSCAGEWKDSAALCRIAPGFDQAVSLGDSVSQMRRLGIANESTMQMKIHSKPVQADDGYIYFASMDEYGETEDGSRLPFYGSNLWRISAESLAARDASTTHWEHLLALPEGIVATGCTGRFVYALGYYQHSLYQFDTKTFGVRKIQVGSSGGHISRNFLVDLQEHVYVPRVVLRGAGDYVIQLIELDTELKEVASHPLADYGATSGFDSHGIVGFAFLRNGDCIFTTAKGALYHLKPSPDSPSTLERLGWFHPDGESYPAVLSSPDGKSIVCGLVSREGEYDWVVYDLEQWRGEVVDLSPSAQKLLQRPGTLAYGSNTRDDEGDAVVVGWYKGESVRGHLPYAARITWPQL